MSILFCHGLESSPRGAKVAALRNAGHEVEAPDFQNQRLEERVATLCALLRKRAQRLPLLVGSSYGGITALCASILLAQEGIDTGHLILCAPALARFEPPADRLELIAPVPIDVLHGVHDEVVPIDLSRRFAQNNLDRVRLHEVEDGHRLAGSIPKLLELVAGAL